MSSETAIEYYWRPGCPFCVMLHRRLTRHDLPLERHDIWQDEAAAARVRGVADGNETVPTVIIGDRALVNPSIDAVMDVLAGERPDLVPADWEPGRPGLVRRALGRLLGS